MRGAFRNSNFFVLPATNRLQRLAISPKNGKMQPILQPLT